MPRELINEGNEIKHVISMLNMKLKLQTHMRVFKLSFLFSVPPSVVPEAVLGGGGTPKSNQTPISNSNSYAEYESTSGIS